ncbi:MAG: Helicase associated domain protein [Lachnospiraceae bacterium]|nr:Helicase associated domain protein [Lachnospiraceae bacterium]
MKVELYAHNQRAYDAAVNLMKQTGKAAVIHPTGTGKSFIGFRLCADHPEGRVLWLSPSEYIFKTQLENLKAATGGEVPSNITFCTYAKLVWMKEEEIREICRPSYLRKAPEMNQAENQPEHQEKGNLPDDPADIPAYPSYMILDEFHRCGAQVWGQGVQKLLSAFPDTPILGLSATNIRYLDNRRDMAEELFDGNIASEMTLGEAIVRGILNPPKYVLSVYSYRQGFEMSSRSRTAAGHAAREENTSSLNGTLEKYEQRVRNTKSRVVRDTCERYLEDLKRALEMSEGLEDIFEKHMPDRTGKYIVFCSNKEHMDEMMKHLEWFAKVDPCPHVYSLYSSDPGADRSFDEFRADQDTSHLRLLYCIDALNEGIHVEGISGVILLRPTVSPIIYKQQIGRALSADRKKESVIFDVVMNVSCLESIGLIEEEMQLVTSYYRALGESDRIVNEHFRIIDEVKDCRELFNKLNDTLSASWDLMFDLAKAYYEENGNLEMASGYMTEDGYPLGHCVATQRGIRRGAAHGHLTEERIRKLDSIGMVWASSLDQLWEKNYTAAKRYYEKQGNLDVKWNYVTEDGVPLGKWLCSLRTLEKAGARQKYLSKERIAMLEDIGMIWGKTDYFWERNYEAASAYYREHGNLDVPATYVNADGIKLGSWLHRIRKERKKTSANSSEKRSTLTEDQIRRLDEIGMIWSNVNDTKWDKAYQEAKDYAAEKGDLSVPARYVTEKGFRLGTWIKNQRNLFRDGKLSASRKEKLDTIGMVWQTDPWEYRLGLVKDWYRENGTLAIPQNTVTDGVWIGKWLNSQKKALEEGKLSQRQAALLSELPLDGVAAASAHWNEMYLDAKEYSVNRGSFARVPRGYRGRSGGNLNVWILNQRRTRRAGKLSEEKIRLLDEIGFVWDPQEVRQLEETS